MKQFHPILLLGFTLCLSACPCRQMIFPATAVLTEGSNPKVCVMIPKNEGFPDTKFYISAIDVSTRKQGFIFEKKFNSMFMPKKSNVNKYFVKRWECIETPFDFEQDIEYTVGFTSDRDPPSNDDDKNRKNWYSRFYLKIDPSGKLILINGWK